MAVREAGLPDRGLVAIGGDTNQEVDHVTGNSASLAAVLATGIGNGLALLGGCLGRGGNVKGLEADLMTGVGVVADLEVDLTTGVGVIDLGAGLVIRVGVADLGADLTIDGTGGPVADHTIGGVTPDRDPEVGTGGVTVPGQSPETGPGDILEACPRIGGREDAKGHTLVDRIGTQSIGECKG